MAETEIVAFDLEGTLSSGIAWEGMRDYLVAHGEGAKFQRFFRKNFLKALAFRVGIVRDERAFKERWILEIMRLFEGYSEARFAEAAAWVVERTFWPNRRDAVVEELLAHRENGRSVIVVSGMFEPILQQFAAKLQVDCIGTPLEVMDGRLTGEIVGQLNVGPNKVAKLQNLPGKLVAAYGDTVWDIPMLELAETAVVVHPDKLLREMAVQRNWRMIDS
ncbi:HAD family hydrolase [Candidatus Leptofilum sp.]|uniref:HAD family hydrolase n=1 Tax=Candidatus Leptofilum sp. TaxID=3241576 RepID=UPI003B59BED1